MTYLLVYSDLNKDKGFFTTFLWTQYGGQCFGLIFNSVIFSQVIYALNTKNDEHEAAIATLKEAHEEEVQQILSETREKILLVGVFFYVVPTLDKICMNHHP